jgi:hypothetical protein
MSWGLCKEQEKWNNLNENRGVENVGDTEKIWGGKMCLCLVDKDIKCLVVLKCLEIKGGEVHLCAVNGWISKNIDKYLFKTRCNWKRKISIPVPVYELGKSIIGNLEYSD